MPVGTQVAVKTHRQEELKEMGSRSILANTYHLWYDQGMELDRKQEDCINSLGPQPALTDSGGFQGIHHFGYLY